jgi:protein SCO1/2
MAATLCRAADDEGFMSGGLNGRAVVYGGVGVVVTVFVAAIAAHFLTSANGPARRGPTETSSEAPGLLRSDPVAERADYDSEKNALLTSYEWTDREHKFGRIPIARAMELQAAAQSEQPATAERRVADWEQRVGARLPLDLAFADESGRTAQLAEYFGSVPVVIVFVYFRCEKLCPEVLGGVDEALRAANLSSDRDYRLLAISIDPRDTPAQAAQRVRLIAAPGVHVLTSSVGNSAQLASAAGFHYAITDDGQFAHPAGFLIATPQGQISRYFFGVRYPASQLRNAVDAAGSGATGGLADRLLMVCFGLDDTHDGRSKWILIALRTLTLAVLGVLAIVGWRHYARRTSR